jgi:hypothetical protein
MNLDRMLSRIVADNDQDTAHAKAWIAGTSTQDLIRFWFHLQQHHEDPMREIKSRLAALKFAELFSEMNAQKGTPQ